MFSPERRRRAVHKLAVVAAALTVCVLPTACDYPLASPPGAPTAPGDGSVDDPTTAPVVVPVGNTTKAKPTRDRGDSTRTRPRTRTPRPSSATTVPAATTTTDPAATTTTDPAATTTTDPAATTTTETAAPPPPPVDGARVVIPPGGADGNNNGLAILGRDCSTSKLDVHNGFQQKDGEANVAKCVETEMGEVAPEDRLPSLLIVDAPKTVALNQEFTLTISTRNLVRDRFLGAAAGGYYLESSFLNGDLLQRGHFHTACRLLPSLTEAPDSSPKPAFFLATEDGKGGKGADNVTITVKGATAAAGTLQCTSWAGDGSHRTPMMTRANQTPAIDSVRIEVGGAPAPAPSPAEEAAAAADAAAQANAQDKAAGTQKPDEYGDGTQGEGVASAPVAPATETSTAAKSSAATPAADESTAPATSSKSLDERFKELREEKGGG